MLKAKAAEKKARKRAKKRREEALESMFDNCECISNMKPKPLLFSKGFSRLGFYVYGF